MPIPEDIMYVRLNFALASGGSPLEGASVGFHGKRFHRTGNTTDWPADVAEVATKVRDHWVTDMSGYKTYVSNACSAVNVEVAHLNTAGKWIDKGTASFDGANAWAGSGSEGLPFQCSVVLSMYGYDAGAFVPQRQYKRGRTYWLPPTAGVLDGDGRLSGSAQANHLSVFSTFFNHVQGLEIGGTTPPATDPDYFDLVVLSATANMATPVRQVGVGRVVDTQRRRRKSLVEARTWSDIDHADT